MLWVGDFLSAVVSHQAALLLDNILNAQQGMPICDIVQKAVQKAVGQLC